MIAFRMGRKIFRPGWSKGKMEENEVVEVEAKEKKRKPKFFIYLEIIGPVFITYSFYSIQSPQSVVHVFFWPNLLHEVATTLSTAYAFSLYVSWGRSWGFPINISLTLGQAFIYCEALRQWFYVNASCLAALFGSANCIGNLFLFFKSYGVLPVSKSLQGC